MGGAVILLLFSGAAEEVDVEALVQVAAPRRASELRAEPRPLHHAAPRRTTEIQAQERRR